MARSNPLATPAMSRATASTLNRRFGRDEARLRPRESDGLRTAFLLELSLKLDDECFPGKPASRGLLENPCREIAEGLGVSFLWVVGRGVFGHERSYPAARFQDAAPFQLGITLRQSVGIDAQGHRQFSDCG